ncbi:Mg-chelatase subunit ChlD [Haloarcula quadrata]|uniref:Mg-chelatase subunit ChlD n=2 Tax=Haloarcula quadrata TaxID=182779 RepID=A0A495QVE7_9EURY|nr:Mg-chelatase subunit ChlD [Haloarcula quadrata]
MTGTGTGPLQTAGNDISGTSTGNQAVTTAGNEPTQTQPTQTPAATAGNQATGPLSTSWNGSTEPNASAIAELAPRENDSHPYPLVGDNQPTDPDGDGLYEDVNGDGAVNIVDVDALSRHLESTAAGANWSAYDYTGDNRTDVGDIQWLFVATRSTPSNDTDGDGLPDAYERNVTKTDPRVADSDGDAVIDGAEDWDNDTLPAYREYRLGTDPQSNDTDGDGLTDDVESRLQSVDPTDPDTDDDGVQDSAADPDNDSLSIYNETVAGTLSNDPDTDGDGLLDGTEVHQLGTDPLKADTDNDGLPDGEEVRLGTDPLVADSNDNGVSDGEESYTTTATNETLGVTLSLTGNGDIGNGTTIAPQDDPRFNTSRVGNMSASPVVELNSEQEFSSANVTLGYNETGVENESQDLAVFTYDPEAGIFVPLNSTVDATNNTATAETTHFSTFAVFDISNWATTYNATEPVRQTDDDGLRPVDVTLVMDTSGSMSSSVKLRNTAGQRFVAGLLDVDRAAVVDFDSSAYVAQDLTSDFGAANSTLDNLGSGGGTDIGSGLSTANSQFASNSNDSRAQVMILLTDGRGNGGISEAQTAANQNTTVYTVGFDNANRDKLRDIANITDGEFNYVTDRLELPNVFSRIAENTTEINDTDGDGLSDEMEREGVILGGPNGDRVTTDPKSADTDGDGLSDSREIGQYTEVSYSGRTASYYNHLANPRQVDTDGDNLTDAEEVAGWEVQRTTSADQSTEFTNTLYSSAGDGMGHLETISVQSDPTLSDSDSDGVTDAQERRYRLDPHSHDTDNDSISDHREIVKGLDPTIHDFQPPEVTVFTAQFSKPNSWADNRATYSLTFQVDDPSAVQTIVVSHDGETKATPRVRENQYTHLIEYRTGYVQSLEDDLSAATTKIRVTDTHGNARSSPAFTRSTIFVEGAQHSEAVDTNSRVAAQGLGFSSGLATTFGSSIESLQSFAKDPLRAIEAISTLLDSIPGLDSLSNLLSQAPAVFDAMVQSYEDRQDRANPYDQDAKPELHKDFRANYFAGMLWGEVARSVTGSQAASAAKRTQTANTVADRLGGTRVMRAARTYSRAQDRAGEWRARQQMRAISQLSKATTVPRSGARRVLKPARTATDTVRIRHTIRRTDVDMAELDPAQQRRLGTLLAENDPAVARAVRQMDQDEIDALTRVEMDTRTRSDFARAYESGEVDSDELTTALTRYDSLDADGKAEFDEMLARNGDDAADFAGRTDSDTFDAVVSPCGARSAPSLGRAGSLRTDRYHSVATPPSTLAQSGGSCPDLPDDVEDDLQDALVNVDGDLDADSVDDVRRSINELDGDAQDSATNLIESEGTDGVSVTNDATDLSDGSDSVLTDGEVDDLVRAYDTYSDKSYGRDVRDIQDDIDDLDQNDVDGLDDAINRGTSSSGDDISSNMKGLDGEVEVNSDLLDRDDIDANDLEMDKQIREDSSWETDSLQSSDYNSNTDIDSDIDGGPAYEVKNLDYEPFAEFPRAYEETADSLDDLRTKLNTFGASGQDEIVVVVRQDADTAFAPEVQRSLSGQLSGAESLRDLGDQVESNFNGVEVTFKRFNEVETS